MRLNIGLDFDDTFSADVPFWRSFCENARKAGHKVYITTARGEEGKTYEFPRTGQHPMRIPTGWNDDIREAIDGLHIDVIYCGYGPKRTRCAQQGVKIDIWIDDNPEWITEGQGGEEIKGA